MLKCLGFVPGMASPHHIREPEREKALEDMLKMSDFQDVAFALDDNAAIVFKGSSFPAVSSKDNARVRLFRLVEQKIVQVNIDPKDGYHCLDDYSL